MSVRVPTFNEFRDLRDRVAALEAGGPPPPPPFPTITPIWSDEIASRIGYTNTKFRFTGSRYTGNIAEVVNLLEVGGFRGVRERLIPSHSDQKAAFSALQSRGFKVHATLGVFNGSANANNFDALAAAVRANPDLFAAVAGPNEPNNTPRPANWIDILVTHQKAIWDRLNDIVQVVGPALKDNEPTMPQDYADLAETLIHLYMHVADFHRYPRGDVPTNGLDERRLMAVAMSHGKGTVCSEGGYNTSPPGTAGGNAVTLGEQAVYAPRHGLEMWLAGVERFVQYEFLDQRTGGTWQENWGLIETPSDDPTTWSPKPAYYAVQKLLQTLNDPGPLYVPEPVPLKITADPDVRYLVTGKRDGSATLTTWLDVPASSTATKPVRVETPESDTTYSAGTLLRYIPVKQAA